MPSASTTDFLISAGSLMVPAFMAALGIFAAYSLILAYHWLRYANRSGAIVTALGTYAIGSALILAFTASAFL